MSLLERLTHWGMTKSEYDHFVMEVDAEIYQERASKQLGLDLVIDRSITMTKDLQSRLDEAEKLGLDRELVYMSYFHGKVMVYFGRQTHSDCCPWYARPAKVA